MSILAWRILVFGVMALCGSASAGALLGGWFAGLNDTRAWISLVLGLALGIASAAATKPIPERSDASIRLGPWDWLMLAIFSLVCLRMFLWVFYAKGDEYRMLLWNNLGDLAKHICYIRFLANGAPFWPENPLHASSSIGYPFAVDLVNALLVLAGLDWIQGLLWMGLIGSALTALALIAWGRGFAVAAFLFNGGLLGFSLLVSRSSAEVQQFVDWKSIPLAIFATQRGYLYAFPAALLLLAIWRDRHAGESETAEASPVRVPFWVETLLYATLPFFHLHTFLFLSFVLGFFMLFGRSRFHAILLAAAAFFPATWQIWLLTDGFHAGRNLAFQPGWMQKDNPFLGYWMSNFGVFLPLLIGAVAYFIWNWRAAPDDKKNYDRVLLLVPPALLLLLTFFIRFAPWEWDNTKLMVWCYLMIVPVLWRMLLDLPLLIRIGMCGLLFYSGAVSLVQGLSPEANGHLLMKRSEVDAARALVSKVDPMATLACAPDYRHPLLLLGRPMVMSYDGFLMGHGIDYSREYGLLNALMIGGDGWEETARELKVRYLYWGPLEQQRWQASEQGWKRCPVVAENAEGAIFDLGQEQ